MGQFNTDSEQKVVELNARILRVMNTTSADLQANRRGTLSDNQQRLLSDYLQVKGVNNNLRNIVVISAVWFIPIIFIIANIMPKLEEMGEMYMPLFPYIIIAMFVGLNLLFFYAIYRSMRMTQKMQSKHVTVHHETGVIKVGAIPPGGGAYAGIMKVLEQGTQKADEPPVVVKVKGKMIFGESSAIAHALVEGEVYRVYYINPVGQYGMIVSAEAVLPSEAN